MKILELYHNNYGCEPKDCRLLPGAGSSRRYFRITNPNGSTIIGTEGDNLQENRAFCQIGNALRDKGIPVPMLYGAASDFSCYLQEDLGDTALFDAIAKGRETGNYSADERKLMVDAVKLLARVQIIGGKDFDYSRCKPHEAMDDRMAAWDLNYFKYCFLKPVLGEVDDMALQDDYDALSDNLLEGKDKWATFMARDFQSRNIMVTPDGLKLIDFQGGRRGPLAYDLVSLLWQAKANIPQQLREELIGRYIDEANALGAGLNEARFREKVTRFAIFRILQTLGAYGFRGLIQGKQHFIESIPQGIANLNTILRDAGASYPYLTAISALLADKYPLRVEEAGLTVTVGSFSYKQGYPNDPSGNGGGFVFDCRAIHNPGRYDKYKKLTGREEAVKRFLEDDGEVLTFLSHAEALVGASIDRYLKRGFTNLSVWFGCTGGRHRSVYCAEAMARYVSERQGVRVRLVHREQGIEETIQPKEL